MTFQRHRRTQTSEYWLDEFAIHKEDLDYLYERLLEEGEPLTADELALRVITRRCEREAQALAKGSDRGVFYQPQERFEAGSLVVFPALDYASGQVVAVREGNNPRYGTFTVIRVQMDEEQLQREFAAELVVDHLLNGLAALPDDADQLQSPAQLHEEYGDAVRVLLEDALLKSQEWAFFDGRWFLRGLLSDVTPFHLNITEALIDEHGKPLSIGQLLDEVGLSGDQTRVAKAFSLGLALEADSRFVMTGTDEEPTWYLSNLIPQGVQHRPQRLIPMYRSRGNEWLNRELREFVFEIDDDADQLEHKGVGSTGDVDRVQIVLPYPHRREGTLPLTKRTLALVTEIPSDRFMVTFVDQRTGENIQGWMLPGDGYALGLGEWYEKRTVPVGGFVELQRSEDPFTFGLNYDEGKRRGEWVLEARPVNGSLNFGLQRKAFAGRYDRHLLIDVGVTLSLDDLWTSPGQEAQSLFEHLRQLFPELAKLSGQGLVNAKTLYAAVNLTRRSGAVPVFAELTRRACFDPVGDGNWVYDESLREVVYGSADEMSRRASSKRHDLIVDRVYRLNMEGNEV